MIMGKHDESICEAMKALELDPKSPLANNTAGNAFLYAGKYDDAIPYFNAALEINPDATNARGNLGLCYVNKGIFDTGISEIKKSIQLQRECPRSEERPCICVRKGRADERGKRDLIGIA